MKIFSSFFAFLLFRSPFFAQTADPKVVASGGGFELAGSFSISYTVGESVITTGVLPSNFVLTQGFQQPDKIMKVGTKSALPDDWDLKIYPNPVNDQLNVEFKSQHISSLSVSVWDIAGRLVISPQDIPANTTVSIVVGTLASGTYLVHFKDENNQMGTFELIKAAQ